MCNNCNDPSHVPSQDSGIDIPALLEAYENQLTTLVDMHLVTPQMSSRDQDFANSLYNQFISTHSLSPRQWEWVSKLLDRVQGSEPVYGDFKSVMVMFDIAMGKLKTPRIRLMTNWRDPHADHRFVQLTFNRDKKQIDVHVDGWAGHGYRKFAGWIVNDRITPWSSDRMTDDVKNCIQDFSMDPLRCAQAMAGLLGACMYCGQRLTDQVSKDLGYGPICAGTWDLPYGPGAAAKAKKERLVNPTTFGRQATHDRIGG